MEPNGETRSSITVSVAQRLRFRAYAEKREREIGGKWTDALTIEHLLNLAEGKTRRHRKPSRRHAICRRGHRRTPENIYVSPGGDRKCIACRTARSNRRHTN